MNHRTLLRLVSSLDSSSAIRVGKLTYDCHAPLDTPFSMAIGPLASEPGAPPVCSLRTIKSDVVVGIPGGVGERLDEEEPGWKISGKYVRLRCLFVS